MSDFTRSRGCGAPVLASTVSAGCACASVVESDCGCGNTCGCQSCPVSCTARPTPGPSTDIGCTCCKASMREALKLLCNNQVSDALDFDGFAFITDDLIVGAQPATMTASARDNLSTLTGTFRRFSPCNCDLIDIAGTAFGPFGSLVDVDQATLCALSAIVFQVRESETSPVSGCCCNDTDQHRYRRVRDILQCELQSIDGPCGECVCHCDCTDDCCCAAGVLAALSGLSLNKRATLVAGLLALRDVTVLGTIGNVLVLGDEERQRFYFVCANKVELLA